MNPRLFAGRNSNIFHPRGPIRQITQELFPIFRSRLFYRLNQTLAGIIKILAAKLAGQYQYRGVRKALGKISEKGIIMGANDWEY